MVAAADYNQAFQALGLALQGWRNAGKMARVFAGYDDDLNVTNDSNKVLWLELYGAVRATDTDSEGLMYMCVASVSSNVTVRLYKSTTMSAGNRIASGTGSGFTAQEISLVEQSSSGVTGLISLDTYSADNDDIVVIPKWNINTLCDDIDPSNSDTELSQYISTNTSDLQKTSRTVGAGILNYQNQFAARVDDYIRNTIARLIDSGNQQSGNILTKTTTVSDGEVSNTYEGILKDLADQMDADSKDFLKCTATIGSYTAGTGQQGACTQTTATPYQYAVDDDQITLTCTKTLDSTCEEFRVQSYNFGNAANALRLGKSFNAPEIAVSALQIDRSVVFSGYSAASGSTYFAGSFSGSSFAITGETDTFVDLNASLIYGQASKDVSDNITISYYRTAARGSSDKIATLVFSNPGNDDPVGKTLAASNSSGITITQPCDDLDSMPASVTFYWTVDLNISEVGDTFKATVANDYAGLWVLLLGRLYKYELPTDTSADISEDYVKIADDFLVDKRHKS